MQPPAPHQPLSAEVVIPRGVRLAVAWSWRYLVVAAAVAVTLFVIAELRLVIIPLLVAVLLCALVGPFVDRLERARLPRALAAAIVLVGGIIGLVLLVWLIGHQVRVGYAPLRDNADDGIREVRDWLTTTGPLHLSQQQLDSAAASVRRAVSGNQSALTAGALGIATTAGHLLTGVLLALFGTFFLLKDGRAVWAWAVHLFPQQARSQVDGAGVRAWGTLIGYVRATVAVAFVDAVGIGVALVVLRVPLALPLAVLVFLGGFIPLIGATLSGLVAVLVALVAHGPVDALLTLGAVVAVQQLEGHVLQPLLLGRAVKIHPLAVVFAIAAGILLAGIIGALVAVPLVAVANTVGIYLAGQARERHLPPESAAVEQPASDG